MFILNKARSISCSAIAGNVVYLESCCRRTIIYNDTSYFLAFPNTVYNIAYSIRPTFGSSNKYHFLCSKLKIGWVLTDDITANTLIYPPPLKNVGYNGSVCQVSSAVYFTCDDLWKTRILKIPKSIMMEAIDTFWSSSFNDSYEDSNYDRYHLSFANWQHITKTNPNWYPNAYNLKLYSRYHEFSSAWEHVACDESFEVIIEDGRQPPNRGDKDVYL